MVATMTVEENVFTRFDILLAKMTILEKQKTAKMRKMTFIFYSNSCPETGGPMLHIYDQYILHFFGKKYFQSHNIGPRQKVGQLFFVCAKNN
jgi:hypothetical protein